MRGIFVCNNYYFDKGMEYCFDSLRAAFLKKGVVLDRFDGYYSNSGLIKKQLSDINFAIFWDKDVYFAKTLESMGIRVFNNSYALEVADDKRKTYFALPSSIKCPKTIYAPLMYDSTDTIDSDFLCLVSAELGFPMIIKENIGSQGRQVYKADNDKEMLDIYQKLRYKPHHYQQYLGQKNCDIRAYVVGDKVVGSCKREGEGFKSNLHQGGKMSLVDIDKRHFSMIESISKALKLDFGALDFLIDGDDLIFLEANSNSYFKGIESLKIDIASKIRDYILS